MKKEVPFPGLSKAREVARSILDVVKDLHNQTVSTVLNPRNVQRMYHGVNWRTHSGDAAAKETSTMKEHRVEHMVKFEDVVAHRLAVVPLVIKTIAEGMRDQLMRELYSKVHESTERSGNVVNAREAGSNALAFLEMLKKIEFGVNEAGQVTRPQIHVGPGNPMLEELRKAGPEFEAQVDEIIQEKTVQALERERDRLSKFKS